MLQRLATKHNVVVDFSVVCDIICAVVGGNTTSLIFGGCETLCTGGSVWLCFSLHSPDGILHWRCRDTAGRFVEFTAKVTACCPVWSWTSLCWYVQYMCASLWSVKCSSLNLVNFMISRWRHPVLGFSVSACIHDHSESLWIRRLMNGLWEFHQIYNLDDQDELTRFWGQNVSDQSHDDGQKGTWKRWWVSDIKQCFQRRHTTRQFVIVDHLVLLGKLNDL